MKTRRVITVALTAAMSFTTIFGTTAFAAENNANEKTVYITVERTLLGNQDLILKPTKVTVPADATVIDVLDEVKKEVSGFDYTSTGSPEEDTAYVTGFKVDKNGPFNYLTDYEFWDQYNTAAGGYGEVYFEYGETPSATDQYLSEKDYNMFGGWIVSANNVIEWDDMDTKDVNEAYPTASCVVSDGTVLRFEYSMALARDCGYEGWSLLTLSDLEPAFYASADKSELIRKMADNPTASSYESAMSVLKNMTIAESEVEQVTNSYK